MDMKRIVKEHYAHKFDNTGETDQFLERPICQNPRKKIDNLTKSTSIKETEPMINNLRK